MHTYVLRVTAQDYICWSLYPRTYTNFTEEVDVTLYSGEGSCGGGTDPIFGYRDYKSFDVFGMDKTTDPTYQGGRVDLSGGTWGQDSHASFDNFKIDPLP